MKSIQQSGLVYFDSTLGQWVTDSYKMYQHFKLSEHKNVTRLIRKVLTLNSKWSSQTTEIIPQILISDRKIKIKGFILTFKGFNKVIAQMGVPRKRETALLLSDHQDDFWNAFQDMKQIIQTDYLSLPKDPNQRAIYIQELLDGERGTVKGHTRKLNKNVKKETRMKIVETALRVMSYSFNPHEELESIRIQIEQELNQ